MLALLIVHIIIGIMAGLMAYIWCEHITNEGMIFGWLEPAMRRIGVSEYWMQPVSTCPLCNSFYQALIFLSALTTPSWLWLPAISAAMFTAWLTIWMYVEQ